ncbi:hypothetical protein Ddye_005952 [Dipteronia dyeriana]|uniref:Transposase n=1 Tax=Dipteronia dyeriana TaxID=168575 RepID=A0AAD9XH89_9ROSI|nr:hypothetical protein Ddye_005952 [Dipteronia dyeriana]
MKHILNRSNGRVEIDYFIRCPVVRRYTILTSNIAECLNSCLRHARQMLVAVLIKFIRDMM